MPKYIVKFMKRLTNDSGHSRTVVQHTFETISNNRDEAAQTAKEILEAREKGPWTLHADTISVEEADFPS